MNNRRGSDQTPLNSLMNDYFVGRAAHHSRETDATGTAAATAAPVKSTIESISTSSLHVYNIAAYYGLVARPSLT